MSRGKNVAEMSGKQKIEGMSHFCCPSTGPPRGVREPCARVVPWAKFNQTGTQRVWGSPLAPGSGDVWLYGLLRAPGSTAVDLATDPL